MNDLSRWHAIVRGHDPTWLAQSLRGGLRCLEPLYRSIVSARNLTFDWGLRKPQRLGRVVISVGNLTAGGVGKTPFVIELARRLIRIDLQPAVLLRGYRGQATNQETMGSDEARLLCEELGPNVPIEADPSRINAAKRVLSRCSETEVFLLDDGFQHRQIHRDLDVVLLDATAPFGFGHVLPRGLLREPIRSITRADAVIITRSDQVPSHDLEQLDERVASITGRRPIAHTAVSWVELRDAAGVARPIEWLEQAKVVGVCGIGNPQAFFSTLQFHCGQLLSVHALPDHHPYSTREIESFGQQAHEQNADALVITGKDWVKWQPLLGSRTPTVPVLWPVMRLIFLDGAGAFDAMWEMTIAQQLYPSRMKLRRDLCTRQVN